MTRGPTWRDRAHAFIATLEIPETATLRDTRRIFRESGSRFHGGTYWGRRAWGKATREFQAKRGLLHSTATAGPLFTFAPDIIFPFRSISE